MRASAIGWEKVSVPFGCRRLDRRLAVRDAVGVARKHSANLLVVQLGQPRGA